MASAVTDLKGKFGSDGSYSQFSNMHCSAYGLEIKRIWQEIS